DARCKDANAIHIGMEADLAQIIAACRTLQIGPRDISLQPEDKIVDLPIIADLATADEAIQILRIGRTGIIAEEIIDVEVLIDIGRTIARMRSNLDTGP